MTLSRRLSASTSCSTEDQAAQAARKLALMLSNEGFVRDAYRAALQQERDLRSDINAALRKELGLYICITMLSASSRSTARSAAIASLLASG